MDADRAGLGAFILRLRRRGITDTRVLCAAIESGATRLCAAEPGGDIYADAALPIECGQTISVADIVGIMTSALEVGPDDRVLEVGTGSGYQTAVLARLAKRVYTSTDSGRLVGTALRAFARCGSPMSSRWSGDGTLGWPEEAPFDRIIVTAAGEKVPQDASRSAETGRHPVGAVRTDPESAALDAHEELQHGLGRNRPRRRAFRAAHSGEGVEVLSFLPAPPSSARPGDVSFVSPSSSCLCRSRGSAVADAPSGTLWAASATAHGDFSPSLHTPARRTRQA